MMPCAACNVPVWFRGTNLRRGLLPQVVEERIAAGADVALTLTVALTHDRGEVVVHDVLRGEVDALGGRGAGRGNVVDGRARCGGGGPLGVDVGLGLVAGETGVGAVVDDVQVLRSGGGCRVAQRQAEERAEAEEVLRVDVGLADDGDGLPGAVDGRGRGLERLDVVDGVEVRRRDSVVRVAIVRKGEARRGSVQS